MAAILYGYCQTYSLAVHAGDTAHEGKELFATHCMACHGPAQRTEITETLGVMPADFADPLFNSREPAEDWFLVIKHGGWALGLSEHMPAFGEVLATEQIHAVVAHIKGLADTSGYPPGELNFVALLRTEKPYPEDEWVWQTRWEDASAGEEDVLKTVLEFEKRFGKSMQALAEFSYEHEGGSGRFDELELGIKYVLATSLQRLDILTATLSADISLTGDDEVVFIPSLRYARQLSDALVLQASTRAKLPKDVPAQGELEFAAGLQGVRLWARSVLPAMELIGEVPLERADGSTRLSLLPQFRYGLTRGGHVAIKFGVEVPLNHNLYNYRLYTSLHWDYADGSLLEGW